jgi:prepilin-type N-terminal cleavage/methylation domain-containing protein
MQNKVARGFTLIELLVVIAIIGLLASIVLVSLNSARSKGRDAKRVAELQQMSRAIALHANFDTSTAWAPAGASQCGNGTAYQIASTCTTPDFTQFNDPSGTTVCTASPTAVCNYTVSRNNGAAAPAFNNWQIKTYLEGTIGQLSQGEVCISNSTSTPFQGASCI